MLIFGHSDDEVNEPDAIGIDGTMKYLSDIGVNLDEVVVLAVSSELGSPVMGELNRVAFIDGWKAYKSVFHSDTALKHGHQPLMAPQCR